MCIIVYITTIGISLYANHIQNKLMDMQFFSAIPRYLLHREPQICLNLKIKKLNCNFDK